MRNYTLRGGASVLAPTSSAFVGPFHCVLCGVLPFVSPLLQHATGKSPQKKQPEKAGRRTKKQKRSAAEAEPPAECSPSSHVGLLCSFDWRRSGKLGVALRNFCLSEPHAFNILKATRTTMCCVLIAFVP